MSHVLVVKVNSSCERRTSEEQRLNCETFGLTNEKMDEQCRSKMSERSQKIMQLARDGLREENGRLCARSCLISPETSAEKCLAPELAFNNNQPSETSASSGQSGTETSNQDRSTHCNHADMFQKPEPPANSVEPQASSQLDGKVVTHGMNFYILETTGLTESILKRVPMPTPSHTRTSSESSSDPCGGESSDSYSPSSSDDSSSGSSDESEVPQVQPVGPSSSHSLSTIAAQDDESLAPADVSKSPAKSPAKRPKKRLKKFDEWERAKAKKLKNSGESYLSRMGKVVEARKMGPPCTEKCKLQCYEKVSDDLRATLFKNYWGTSSFQRQRDFLNSCVEPIQVKYRRILLSAQKTRKPNCGFYITDSERKIRVCKTFLINTLGISERVIRTVIQGKMSGTGVAPTDGRGKHGKHRKTDPEVLASVRSHIQSIARIESHYVRRDTTREFINGGSTVSQLHKDYSKERISANLKPANYDTYWHVFNIEFNIGFFLPKKDQCDACEGYRNATGEQKQELEELYQLHQEEKALSREEKNMDKEKAKRKEIHLAVYDLQAVLPVPMGQSSAFFYKSRLNCYNFTVTEIGNDKSFCYFWHEGIGNRGVVEIGSCVLHYLEELSNDFPGANVVFYSDNCGGQQKNKFLIAMYLYAVQRLNIQTITHKYLIRGHTQNEGDAVHSIIEKSVTRAKKSGPIYVPEQYVTLIRNAKKKGQPLKVREMNFSDFKDIKALFNDMGLVVTKDTDGDDFKLSEVKILWFEKGSDEFSYKKSYKQAQWSKINIFPKRRRARKSTKPADLLLSPAYSTKIRISDNKIRDLNSPFYKSFYDSLNKFYSSHKCMLIAMCPNYLLILYLLSFFIMFCTPLFLSGD